MAPIENAGEQTTAETREGEVFKVEHDGGKREAGGARRGRNDSRQDSVRLTLSEKANHTERGTGEQSGDD